MRKLVENIRNILNLLFYILYPCKCVSCGSLIHRSDICICPSCRSNLQLETLLSTYVNERLFGSPLFSGLYTLYHYTTGSIFKKIILSLKYYGEIRVAQFLSNKAIYHINFSSITIDLVIAVPIDEKRRRKRGYNQSYEIAKGIAKNINKPCLDDVILRVNPNSQTRLNKMSRHKNAMKSYKFNQKYTNALIGKSVLLVDDVMTTGSTLLSCMDELEFLGVFKVYVFVAGVSLSAS